MNAVFLAFLIGGLLTSALLAALGGHSHIHAGPAHAHLHGGAPHAQLAAGSLSALSSGAHPAGAAPAGSAHAPAVHTSGLQAAWGQGPMGAMLGWALSWLSPLGLAGAALGFGGAGLLASLAIPAYAPTAAIVGAASGAAGVRALIGAFVRSETPALQTVPAGAEGVLSAPIREDGVGEVIYTLEGLRRSAPARRVDGGPLPRGSRVVIVRREAGIAWVVPLDPLAGYPDGIPPPVTAPEISAERR